MIILISSSDPQLKSYAIGLGNFYNEITYEYSNGLYNIIGKVLEPTFPVTRITFIGHCSTTSYGDDQFTSEAFSNFIRSLPKALKFEMPIKNKITIDLIGCEIGFTNLKEGLYNSFAEEIVIELNDINPPININAFALHNFATNNYYKEIFVELIHNTSDVFVSGVSGNNYPSFQTKKEDLFKKELADEKNLLVTAEKRRSILLKCIHIYADQIYSVADLRRALDGNFNFNITATLKKPYENLKNNMEWKHLNDDIARYNLKNNLSKADEKELRLLHQQKKIFETKDDMKLDMNHTHHKENMTTVSRRKCTSELVCSFFFYTYQQSQFALTSIKNTAYTALNFFSRELKRCQRTHPPSKELEKNPHYNV